MISGHDFVIISSLDWDFLWQGPHEIATRLALAAPDSREIVERRRRVAALSDWQARLETMSALIEEALQVKRVGPGAVPRPGE